MRRLCRSATSPPTMEKASTATNRTPPTTLTAIGSRLSWLMCQKSAHCCIWMPIMEMIRPTQIR